MLDCSSTLQKKKAFEREINKKERAELLVEEEKAGDKEGERPTEVVKAPGTKKKVRGTEIWPNGVTGESSRCCHNGPWTCSPLSHSDASHGEEGIYLVRRTTRLTRIAGILFVLVVMPPFVFFPVLLQMSVDAIDYHRKRAEVLERQVLQEQEERNPSVMPKTSSAIVVFRDTVTASFLTQVCRCRWLDVDLPFTGA